MKTALFHITHYKAGSQWIYAILKDIFPKEKLTQPLPWVEHVTKDRVSEGLVYPTVYLDYESFQEYTLSYNCKYFIVFRDLRDTLVSLYFSLLKTHSLEGMGHVSEYREKLKKLSLEDSLLLFLNNDLAMNVNAYIQSSWVEAGEEFIRYEDLLENDVEILSELFLNKLNLPLERKKLEKAIINNRFDKLSQGREKGVEDQSSHYRKGVQGDWANYFTDEIKVRFKEKYGQLLIDTGYEKDMDW